MNYNPRGINHKLYTQSYFLIHNNGSYMHSFGKRAAAVAVSLSLLGIFAYQNWSTRLPASRPIKWLNKQTYLYYSHK